MNEELEAIRTYLSGDVEWSAEGARWRALNLLGMVDRLTAERDALRAALTAIAGEDFSAAGVLARAVLGEVEAR